MAARWYAAANSYAAFPDRGAGRIGAHELAPSQNLFQEGTMKRFAIAACVALAASCVEAAAADVVVRSFCPMTKASGIGRGPTYDVAKMAAIQACLANGGMRQCCSQFTRRIS
jgi:hypothetical protein